MPPMISRSRFTVVPVCFKKSQSGYYLLCRIEAATDAPATPAR